MEKMRSIGLLYGCVVMVGVFFATSASAVITSVVLDPAGFGTAETTTDGAGYQTVTITGSTSSGPILKIFNTDGANLAFGSFELVENITNDGPDPWFEWYEQLLVPDGSGGWTPSTSSDELLFIEDVSYLVDGTFDYGDLDGGVGEDWLSIYTENGVEEDQTINITKYIAVPTAITQFAIIESPFEIDAAMINSFAVPVPAAVWLFGAGLLGLIGMARRKKTI